MEQNLRQKWVSKASHSAYLEGLTVSSDYASDSETYVAGEISASELVRVTRERYGLG